MNFSRITSLLRTPEEEGQIARKNNSPRYAYSFYNGKQKITVYGYRHTYNFEDVYDMTQTFITDKPDLLLYEGNSAKRLEKIKDMKPEEIIREYGEQSYIVKIAYDADILVKSWDIPFEEQITKIQGKHSQDAILGWIIAQGIKHIQDSKRPQRPEPLINMFEIAFSMRAKELQKAFKIDLSKGNIERVAQKYFHKHFAEIAYSEGELFATPRRQGETNNVIRDMNHVRNVHAVKVIAKEKENYSSLFVTCGSGHSIVWEPALRKIFS